MSDMSRENGFLTVIVPSLNEEAIIKKTTGNISAVLFSAGICFEILIVDDGSSDGSWRVIEEICASRNDVTAIKFSRNFGKESAIYAGLQNAAGDCCVVIDCDLQQPPEAIVQMYELWKNNEIYIIEGKKTARQNEPVSGKLFARLYYRLLKKMSGIDLNNASDFKLLDRKAVDILVSMPEKHTFFRAITGWTGLASETVYYQVGDRKEGKSRFSFVSLFKLAINSITSFTSAPMHIVTFFGTCFLLFAVALFIQSLYMKFTGRADAGFTTVIILLLIVGGFIMISLGIIGVYLSKIYDEIKCRPRFIISKKLNANDRHTGASGEKNQ